MAKLRALGLALGILSSASALNAAVGGASGVDAAQVATVFSEVERRCMAGDVDGATQAGLMWWKPTGRRMTKAQFHRLLDVCLAQHGMLGEGKGCALGSQKQCEWARHCVKTKDCEDPPLAEILMQLKAFNDTGGLEASGLQNTTEKKASGSLLQSTASGDGDRVTVDDAIYWAKTRPEMIYPPGTWISRCPACNLALNVAWWAKEDGRTLYDMPFYSSLDRILWDMVIPYIAKNTNAPRQKQEVELAELEVTTAAPPKGMPKFPLPTWAEKAQNAIDKGAAEGEKNEGDKKHGPLDDLKDTVTTVIQDKVLGTANDVAAKVQSAIEPSRVK